MLLAYQFAEFLNHGFQCSLFHRFLDGILNPMVWGFQHFADILCHRAGATLTGMNPNQRGDPFGFQCGIDPVQRDLGRIGTQLGTAGPSGHRDESRFFQSTENVADYNGITASTFRQEIAGHFDNPLCFVNKYQTMNRNGAFYTDLHNRIQYPFKMN